jgi:hypothetical protein
VTVNNRWLNLDLDCALIFTANRLLASLWEMARARYVGWPLPDRSQVPRPISEVLQATTPSSGISLEEVSIPPALFSPPGSGADGVLASKSKADSVSAERPADDGGAEAG